MVRLADAAGGMVSTMIFPLTFITSAFAPIDTMSQAAAVGGLGNPLAVPWATPAGDPCDQRACGPTALRRYRVHRTADCEQSISGKAPDGVRW